MKTLFYHMVSITRITERVSRYSRRKHCLNNGMANYIALCTVEYIWPSSPAISNCKLSLVFTLRCNRSTSKCISMAMRNNNEKK